MRARLQARRLAFLPLPARLLQSNPSARLATSANRLERLDHRAHQAAVPVLSTRRQRLERSVSRLESVNPLAVLARGYAMVTEPRTRTIIKSIDQTGPDADIDVRLADGSLRCTVREKRGGE
jgi:exodeoxyribonuclease VII large subunit